MSTATVGLAGMPKVSNGNEGRLSGRITGGLRPPSISSMAPLPKRSGVRETRRSIVHRRVEAALPGAGSSPEQPSRATDVGHALGPQSARAGQQGALHVPRLRDGLCLLGAPLRERQQFRDPEQVHGHDNDADAVRETRQVDSQRGGAHQSSPSSSITESAGRHRGHHHHRKTTRGRRRRRRRGGEQLGLALQPGHKPRPPGLHHRMPTQQTQDERMPLIRWSAEHLLISSTVAAF